MKHLIVLMIALFSLNIWAAPTLEELAQREYVVTLNGAELPVYNIIELDAEGNVLLTEVTPEGELVCMGTAFIDNNDVLNSVMTCDNGLTFTQTIYLNTINMFDGLSGFTVDVASSLYGGQVMTMKFVNRAYTDK